MITTQYNVKTSDCGHTRTIRVLKPLLDCEVGKLVTVKVSPSGIPINSFWRRRFKDMQIDNCIEFVDESCSVSRDFPYIEPIKPTKKKSTKKTCSTDCIHTTQLKEVTDG